MRPIVASCLLAIGCFREAPPCDEQTAMRIVAECRAAYTQCVLAGKENDCPATRTCLNKALDRQAYCEKQMREDE